MPSTEFVKLARAGWVLIVLDVANWFFWISLASDNVQKGRNTPGDVHLFRAGAGLLALAAPHTVLVPTLGAILSDLDKHCSSGQCLTLETPSWQWYVFAFLVIPFDCISLAYNLKVYPDDKSIVAASAWSVADTVLVAMWVVASLYFVRKGHARAGEERAALGEKIMKGR